MAKRPGAGGIILVALVLGIITAYVVWNYVNTVQKSSKANWKPVVVARLEIPPRKNITRDMIELTRSPEELIATDAITRLEEAEGRMSTTRIRAKDQMRTSIVAKKGEAPGLTYSIPPGKRAIAIKVDETSGVGGNTILPEDHVDILATYTDPIARQETTQMILQNVPVLAVDSGQTEANSEKGGAKSTITLAVSPEDAELITAADRAGVLRVALRPVEEETIVASPGTKVTEILRGKFTVTQPTEDSYKTPIVISPAPSRARPELKIYRGTTETVVTGSND